MSDSAVSPTATRTRGWLLVVCGGVIGAFGSLASMRLVVAASGAVPGNYFGAVLALLLGGVLGCLVAAMGFVHLDVTSRIRVAMLAVVVGVLGLSLPWLLAVMSGVAGYGSVG